MKARENPFATWRVEQMRYRFDGLDWDALFHRFDQLKRRAALVGHHGTGKTTLAEEFAERWKERTGRVHFHRLNEADRSFAADTWREAWGTLGDTDLVLLDGAEQLSAWDWRKFRRLTQSAGGVLITTHRAGRLPTLHECRTTPQLLESLVMNLAPAGAWPDRRTAAALFNQHRGNVREALRDLYDVFAAQS